jgi:thiol-disulfide isomerase/thioredoxin
VKSQLLAVTKPGCPACEETKPVLGKLKKKVSFAKVSFAEVNADSHPSAVRAYGVEAFPDFIYENRNGKVFHMPWKGIPKVTNVVRWVDDVKKGSAPKSPSKAAKNECVQCGNGNGSGVSPAVWGPPVWFIIHMVALMYPRQPSPRERQEARDFFTGLQKVLPCSYCKKHFAEELATLDPDTFRNRDTLFEWTVKFHDSVTERVSKYHPEKKQPRHTVNYWRKYYKLVAMRAGKDVNAPEPKRT